MPLPENEIKSELSYAYLHGVAARAGCECQHGGRHSDNLGIDARLTAMGQFAPAPSLTVFDVYVQLKATSQELALVGNRYSFRLEKGQYNRMRATTVNNQWILVVLILPEAAGGCRGLAENLGPGFDSEKVCLLGEPAGGPGTPCRAG